MSLIPGPSGGGGSNTLMLAIDATRMLQGANDGARAGRILGDNIRDATYRVVQAENALDNAGNQARQTAGDFDNLTGYLKRLVMAYAGFTALRGAATSLSDFEQAVHNIGAAGGATAAQLIQISGALKELNQSSRFSLSEIEQSMLGVVRAGFSVDDALRIVPDALRLAAASFGDVRSAADTTADVLKSFSLNVNESGRVADVLSNLANKTAADITEIKDAIATVAPVASNLGIPLEQVAAGIATLTERGLRARIGALGLKEMLIQLSPAMDKANPEKVGLVEALEKLSGKHFTASQQMAIFSKEVVQVTTTLLNNVDRFKELIDAASQLGTAEKIVAEQNNTMAYGFKQVGAAANTYLQAVGEQSGLSDAIKTFLSLTSQAILLLAGDARAKEEATQTTVTFAKALHGALDVGLIAVGAGLTTMFLRMGMAVNTALGPVGALSAAVSVIGYIALTAVSDIDLLDGKLAKLSKTAKDLRFEPTDINQQLERISRVGAVMKVALESHDIEGERKATNDRIQYIKDFENELKIIQAQGRYTQVSLTQLSQALGIAPEELKKFKGVMRDLENARGLDSSFDHFLVPDVDKLRPKVAERLRQMAGMLGEETARVATTEQLVDEAKRLGIDVEMTPTLRFNQSKLESNANIYHDSILQVLMAEQKKLEDKIKDNPSLQIDPLANGANKAKSSADAIARNIDELMRKFEQRAKNAGNINVFDEIVRKLREETSELTGDTVARAQNKAIIDAQNFAKQQGVELTDDQIEALKQEVVVQQQLIKAHEHENELIRIRREKLAEANDEIYAVETELETLTMSDREREKAIALRKAEAIAIKANSEEVTAAVEKLKAEIELLSRMKLFKEIGQDIAEPFGEAIESMILKTKDLETAIEDMAKAIVQNILRTMVIQPLTQGATSLITSLMAAVAGGVGGSSGGNWSSSGPTGTSTGNSSGWTVYRHAQGDIATGPNLFSSPGRAMNLIGEDGPEGVLPLTRDRQGRLAVHASGSQTVINATVNVQAANPAEFGRSQRQVSDSLRGIIRSATR